MSLSQMISFCLNGRPDTDPRCEFLDKRTPMERCKEASEKLEDSVRETHRIAKEKATASRLLRMSSIAVTECLSCPAAFDSGAQARKDLP